MKRFITLLMVAVMVCSLAACSKKASDDSNANQNVTDNVQTDNSQIPDKTEDNEPVVTDAPVETPSVDTTEEVEDVSTPDAEPDTTAPAEGTPATLVIADFTNAVNTGAATSEEIVAAMFQTEYLPLGIATMPVEPGYLNGFDSEVEGFAEGTMFGPWIGSIPFIGYVFTVADASAIDAFMATLKDKADLRWNICTSADELQVTAIGDKVCLVMAPLSFDEE